MANQCCLGLMTDSNKKSNAWSMNRSITRRSWNNAHFNCDSNSCKTTQTPMRIAWNSGDVLLRQNYVCGGGTQTNARAGQGVSIGAVTNNCSDVNAPAPSYANNKWVYDGSDRVRYLKEKADGKFYKRMRSQGHSSRSEGSNSGAVATMAVANALWRVRK